MRIRILNNGFLGIKAPGLTTDVEREMEQEVIKNWVPVEDLEIRKQLNLFLYSALCMQAETNQALELAS